MSVTGFVAFQLYQGLHFHFTQPKYDFFRFNGQVKWVSMDKFEIRRDKYFFHRLAKKYPDKDELTFFLAANFFTQKVDWVRDITSDESDDVYIRCKRIKESLEYVVIGDLRDQGYTILTLQESLTVTNGQYPTLLTKALEHDIHEETLIVLNALIEFLPTWGNKITENILFPATKLRLERYTPFLQIDIKKFRASVKKQLTSRINNVTIASNMSF